METQKEACGKKGENFINKSTKCDSDLMLINQDKLDPSQLPLELLSVIICVFLNLERFPIQEMMSAFADDAVLFCPITCC